MSGYTRQEVAQRAGVDPDYVDRLVELGILTPAAGAAFSPGDALQLAKGFRPVVIERWLRVCGDSLRRITETETAWWDSEIVTPLLESGRTEREMLEAQADLGSRMGPLREQAFLAIYHGQEEHAWGQGLVELVEGALERAGLYRRLERPPAMCLLDITGYTRLTEKRGDEAAADLAARLASLVRRSSQAHGGTPVKWLGDG